MSSRFTEFRYGWPVVASAALGIGLGMSPLPFYTIGVFVAPLTAEFGWSVGQVMTSLPVFTICAIIMSPVIGFLTDRFGVRRVVLVSIVTFGLTMMSFALNTGSIFVYLFLWTLLAVSGAGTLPITWTRAVTSWFHEKRGLALGFALVGTGLFGIVAKFYAAFLIDLVGWRMAYVGVGMLPLVIAFPAAFFWFYDADDPAVADKVAKLTKATEHLGERNLGGLSIAEALKSWRLYLLGFCFIPISFAVGGPIPNLETMLGAKGFSTQEAVSLASIIGIAVIVGRLAGGYLIDHIWAPLVAAVLLSVPAIAVYMLAQVDVTYLIAATAIFAIGLAAGVEYDLMAYLVSRYFGLRNYAFIYGMLYGFFAAGAGFGPWIFGEFYDVTGSYDQILMYSAIAFVVGAVPLLLLGKYPVFDNASARPDTT